MNNHSDTAITGKLKSHEYILNVGPQHPSTHGVLRLELLMEEEVVKQTIPHIGYLHRCFEKHAEKLNYNQIIPYTDRIDYLSSMNNNYAFVMGVEKLLGIEDKIPQRVHYIRALVCELNRIASHLVSIGTFAIDIGSITPFLWCFRDREHIVKMLEWASGARLLYNYIWVGGLFYDLPIGFEKKCIEFVCHLETKLPELDLLLTDNKIFRSRTEKIGNLPLDVAINYGCSGPVLRASGLKWDVRRIDGYGIYPELDFEIIYADGTNGCGDSWNRFFVRIEEIKESCKIVVQCAQRLLKELKRNKDFDPREAVPKKIFMKEAEYYVRAENPRGELGFYFITQDKKDIPYRVKARGPSFSNLSVIEELGKNVLLSDLIAILGSIDIVLGEVDR